MEKLKVSFNEPEHGWIGLSMICGEQSVFIDAASHTESFDELVNALLGCFENKSDIVVAWLLEPAIAELHFTKQGETVTLEVTETLNVFDTSTYKVKRVTRELQLSVSGTYAQICLPFWRALQSLEAKYSKHELEVRLQDTFPTERLSKLTAQIRTNRVLNC